MADRVGAIPNHSGWPPDRPQNQTGPRKKKPSSFSADEQPSPPDEDYYAPSEPDEEA